MRKKTISKTYMRGVTDWEFISIKRKEENFHICIKKINEVDKPFILDRYGKETAFIDNGYYIVEFTPLNELYNARAFLDKNLDIIGYYFDISLENGVEDCIPYYDDLYLDVIYDGKPKFVIEIEDKDELEEALNSGKITQEQYDLANKKCSDLVEEIVSNRNIFINMNIKDLIHKYFK